MMGQEGAAMADSNSRIVIAYAVWATICAVLAGVVMAFIHTEFFSYVPSRAAFMSTLSAIAAGQAAVILVTGSLLAARGVTLQGTVLLGLLIGTFDFLMNLLQLMVPALEPGWTWDLIIIAVATIAITLLGAKQPTASGA
jgi:hypothetical protein